MTIFFISDTHFSHEKFLTFQNEGGHPIRVFENAEHMDETMIERWNAVVRPGDKIYHLGDVTFNMPKFKKILPRLRGRKRLIVGNHDDIKALSPFFEKVQLWRIFRDEDFVCTHIPIPKDQFRHKAKVNVHGHIHQNLKAGPYVNVCVEHTNYSPVAMDDLKLLVNSVVV